MTGAIPSPSAAEGPFNSEFQRSYLADGLAGEESPVIESEFVLDAHNRVARFRVMGNRTELERRSRASSAGCSPIWRCSASA